MYVYVVSIVISKCVCVQNYIYFILFEYYVHVRLYSYYC